MSLKICLKLYKKAISPLLHLFPNSGCRFYPSCSDYSYQAIRKYGFSRGILKTIKRIIRCNPLNKGGYDPC